MSDALLERSSTADVRALVAHELGHWVHGHALKRWAFAHIALIVKCCVLAWELEQCSLLRSSGVQHHAPYPYITFYLFRFAFLPVERLLQLAANCQSRKHEWEADLYAKKLGLGGELASVLDEHQGGGSSLTGVPALLYRALYSTHPPTQHRVTLLRSE